MSKQRKPSLPKGRALAPGQLNRWLAEAERNMIANDHAATIDICGRALADLPANAPRRADFLALLGGACGMLKRFEESYQAFAEAVEIDANDATLWYNLGQSARFTMRTGESLVCFERAAETETDQAQAKRIAKEVEIARKIVASELKLRGRDFTLSQLVEQQGLFREANNLMEEGNWAEAEELLRQVIAMADILPQPQGNLALCLIMQRRFDEAETALHRALKIDPKYDLARQNLAALPEIRRTDQLPAMQLRDPMANVKVERSMIFDRG